MAEARVFKTSLACALSSDAQAEHQTFKEWGKYSNALRRRGERQIRCAKCLRWRYESDRCNLFEPS